jgi:hypothetical protein
MNKPTYEELEAAMIEKTSEWAALAGRRLAELTRLRAQVALDERTKAAMLREGLQERDALRARVAEQEEKAERYRLDALKFEARNARLVAVGEKMRNALRHLCLDGTDGVGAANAWDAALADNGSAKEGDA